MPAPFRLTAQMEAAGVALASMGTLSADTLAARVDMSNSQAARWISRWRERGINRCELVEVGTRKSRRGRASKVYGFAR